MNGFRSLLSKLAKHVSHEIKGLWPAVIIFLASLVLGVASALTSGASYKPSPLWMIAFLLRPLACLGLVYLLVRRTVGRASAGSEYWKKLALTFLSFVVFIMFPLFVSHLAILHVIGISPGEWITALVWRQAAFFVYFILPMFALTLTTRNLLQTGIAVLLLGVGWMALSSRIGNRYRDPDGRDWLICGLVILVGAATVTLMRGVTNRRSVIWPVMGVAGILCCLAFNATPWRYFAPTELFTNDHINAAAIQIEFDQSRAGTKPKERPLSNPIEVVIPVRLTVNERDMKVMEYRSSFMIEGESRSWLSGWLNWNAFTRLGEPDAWVVLAVDPTFYGRNNQSPVRLEVDSALTVTRRIKPLSKVRGSVADIDGYGQCRYSRTSTGAYASVCFSPLYPAVLADDTLYLSFAAVPFRPGFDPLYATNEDWGWTEPRFHQLSIEASVAQIRRRFKVNGLKLSDYEMDVPPIRKGGDDSIDF